MLYTLNQLSREELEKLYIKESQKYLSAMDMKISHNSIQAIRLNLGYIYKELRKRQLLQRFSGELSRHSHCNLLNDH